MKNPGFKKFGPPQAENFEDLGGCFMPKMPPDCTQEHVFLYKNASASAFVWLEKRKETVATQSKTHETQWQSIYK